MREVSLLRLAWSICYRFWFLVCLQVRPKYLRCVGITCFYLAAKTCEEDEVSAQQTKWRNYGLGIRFNTFLWLTVLLKIAKDLFRLLNRNVDMAMVSFVGDSSNLGISGREWMWTHCVWSTEDGGSHSRQTGLGSQLDQSSSLHSHCKLIDFRRCKLLKEGLVFDEKFHQM